MKRDNNTTPGAALQQEIADIEENASNVANVNASASNIPLLRNHQFSDTIAQFNMTGCMCLTDPNGLQGGIDCAHPVALNASQSLVNSVFAPAYASTSSSSSSSSLSSDSQTSSSASQSSSSVTSSSMTSSPTTLSTSVVSSQPSPSCPPGEMDGEEPAGAGETEICLPLATGT